jgi:glycogenin glucosyltransferase
MLTYLTVLTTDHYPIGAVALWESLQRTCPRYGFAVLLTKLVSEECERALNRVGLSTLRVDHHLVKPDTENSGQGFAHWDNTLSKLLVFDLEQYEKVVYLDSDMMVLRNLDHLFEKPHMTATVADMLTPGHESWVQFCSGLMVIEPKAGLSSEIVERAKMVAARTPDYGDQDLLHEHFADWPSKMELHLDQGYGVFPESVDFYVRKYGYNLNFANPDERTIAAIHFVGTRKPWSWGVSEKAYRLLTYISRGKFNAVSVVLDYLRLLRSAREKMAST